MLSTDEIAYTDYPLVELGDKENVEAPIRCVTLRYYDGDKYVTVEYMGQLFSFKAGYLYTTYGRHGKVKSFSRDFLEKLQEGPL